MPGILDEIVDVKRREVERLKVETPRAELERRIETQTPALNLAGALMGDRVRVIGEAKRSSPVKGLLREDFDPVALATAYAENGAAAISVLTNVEHFGGSIADMVAVRERMYGLGVPVLRKDFLFDPYQVHESRAHGADAILLIVSILPPDLLAELIALSRTLWMQCLVEVHDEAELETAVSAGAEIVGINNRNLRTFETSLEVTERLAPLRAVRPCRRQRERHLDAGRRRPRGPRRRPRDPRRRGARLLGRSGRQDEGAGVTKFKICGVRDADNALVAADSGADFLGFNFVPGVRRQIPAGRRPRGDRRAPRPLRRDSPASRRPLRRPAGGRGEPHRRRLRASTWCSSAGRSRGTTCVSYGRRWSRWSRCATRTDWRRPPPERSGTRTSPRRPTATGLLLDKIRGRGAKGGTGHTFDWRVAATVAERHDIMLAGGLNPENVRRAIDVVSPWGVDVSSGVRDRRHQGPRQNQGVRRSRQRTPA